MREPHFLDLGGTDSISSQASSSVTTGRVDVLISVVPLPLSEELVGGLEDDTELGSELDNDVVVDPEDGSLLDDEDAWLLRLTILKLHSKIV